MRFRRRRAVVWLGRGMRAHLPLVARAGPWCGIGRHEATCGEWAWLALRAAPCSAVSDEACAGIGVTVDRSWTSDAGFQPAMLT
jgi:hypothetical protein